MRQEEPEEKAMSDGPAGGHDRAWYSQIASISNSVMLVVVMALGGVVAYYISDMRRDLHAVVAKVAENAPSVEEKNLLIKELREESAQLKERLAQMQKEAARLSVGAPTVRPPGSSEKKVEKLSESGNAFADCINAALNGKGAIDKKCAGSSQGELVLKSRG